MRGAQAEEHESASSVPRLDLAVVGKTAEYPAIERHVLSWFRAQNTPISSRAVEAVDSTAVFAHAAQDGVRVWLVLESPVLVRVIFSVQDSTASAPRYLVHDVTLDSGLDEIGLEQLAQVVYLSASALWAGSEESTVQEVVQSLPVAPAKELEPVAPTPAPRAVDNRFKLGYRAGLEYRARFAGSDGIEQGPGITLGLAWRKPEEQRVLTLHTSWLMPHQPTNAGVQLDLRGASFSLGAQLARRIAEHTWLDAELGPGLDLLRYRTLALTNDSLRAHAGAWNYRPFVWLGLGAHYDLGGVSLAFAALVSTSLERAHYDVSNAGHTSELFSPWLVQPGLAAGAFF